MLHIFLCTIIVKWIYDCNVYITLSHRKLSFNMASSDLFFILVVTFSHTNKPLVTVLHNPSIEGLSYTRDIIEALPT